MQATAYKHIVFDKNGAATIEGTNTKIIELIQEIYAHGWSPEEIHFQHPRLSLGQIHSALAFYHDHIEDFQAEMQHRLEKVETIRAEIGQSKIADKLRKS